jgi:hypothetical protein
MESRHHDAPLSPVRAQDRYNQFPEGAAAYSATQLLTAGTDLNTVAGRLGHAEGSTTLKFYAQFTRPADQLAAAVVPTQLDGLRKKERLRELYRQAQPDTDLGDLASATFLKGCI